MAAIDMSGYVADLKDHAAEHGFHIHDERHFVETYSLRQAWKLIFTLKKLAADLSIFI